MRPFPTVHRVYSQGYLLYKQTKKLKAEYVGLKSSEVAAKYREGVEIHDKIETPEVAYTGKRIAQITSIFFMPCA